MKNASQIKLSFNDQLDHPVEYYYLLINKISPECVILADGEGIDGGKLYESFQGGSYMPIAKKISQGSARGYDPDDAVFKYLKKKKGQDEEDEIKVLYSVKSKLGKDILFKFSKYADGEPGLQLAGSFLQEDEIKGIIQSFSDKSFKKEKKQEIGIVAASGGHISLKTCTLDPITIDLDVNYGEGFKEIHESIVDKLNERKNGLYIFRGCPGSGKSSYIKYLSKLSERKLAYIPVSMIDSLVQPNFSNFLLDNRNLVLVIEDAEKAVISRNNKTGNEAWVSAILNLSDGILGSLLNTSIILTFNTDATEIDTALLRKGRLLVDHEFDILTIKEAQKVADKLGKKHKVTEPMVLSDIYCLEDKSYKKEEKKVAIGFGK